MLLPLTVSCFSEIQIGFTFLVPAHPGSPGQRAVKRVCVCNINSLILFCEGVEARDVLSKTSLPVKTLAQIWYVS